MLLLLLVAAAAREAEISNLVFRAAELGVPTSTAASACLKPLTAVAALSNFCVARQSLTELYP